MESNNKKRITDKYLRGIEKYRDDKELLDFLEAYFMFRIQDENLRKLNKEDLNFTMDKLYGIMELRELLIQDTKPEEQTEKPIKDGSVHSLLSKVQNFMK